MVKVMSASQPTDGTPPRVTSIETDLVGVTSMLYRIINDPAPEEAKALARQRLVGTISVDQFYERLFAYGNSAMEAIDGVTALEYVAAVFASELYLVYRSWLFSSTLAAVFYTVYDRLSQPDPRPGFPSMSTLYALRYQPSSNGIGCFLEDLKLATPSPDPSNGMGSLDQMLGLPGQTLSWGPIQVLYPGIITRMMTNGLIRRVDGTLVGFDPDRFVATALAMANTMSPDTKDIIATLLTNRIVSQLENDYLTPMTQIAPIMTDLQELNRDAVNNVMSQSVEVQSLPGLRLPVSIITQPDYQARLLVLLARLRTQSPVTGNDLARDLLDGIIRLMGSTPSRFNPLRYRSILGIGDANDLTIMFNALLPLPDITQRQAYVLQQAQDWETSTLAYLYRDLGDGLGLPVPPYPTGP